MARLPEVGGDNGNWGEVLNEFLVQSHTNDGTLKTDSVGAAQIKSQSVTNAALLDNTITAAKLNGLGSANGIASLDTNAQLPESQIPTRLTAAGLSAVFAPKWQANTAYTAGQQIIAPNGNTVTALSTFTSGSSYSDANWRIGTDPSSAPVAKPAGDTRAGVWEYTHASSTGYLFHLLAGSGFAFPASLIALGLDNGSGGGILIANKAAGVGLAIRQQATISDAAAYGLKIEGLSTIAPSLRVEQNVNGAADAAQLLAFGVPTVAQKLLYVGVPTGEAGSIFASDGRIEWKRPVRVRAESGSIDNYMEVTENGAYPIGDPAAYTSRQVKKGLDLYSPNGGGALWRFGIESGGSYLNIRTGAAGLINATPTYDVVKIQHQKIAFLGTTPQAQKARIGVYTPTAAPAAYDQAESAAFRTAVAAKINALEALMSASTNGFGFTA